MMLALIEQLRPRIESLCRAQCVTRLDLFGSAARGDFHPGESDVDFVVEFEPLGWEGSSDRYFALLHGLEDLLRTRVDLVDRKTIGSGHFLELTAADRINLYAAPIAKAS